MKTFLLFVSTVFLFQIALAEILHVPGNYTSIQAALNAADDGDTVLVQPGTYIENIIWPEEHGIRLIAAGDTTNTIIDGNYSGSVIEFPSSFFYDVTTRINGFTITHGSNSGIFMWDADITMENLHITENIGSEYYESRVGGGMICYYSSPLIKDSKIDNNSLEGYSTVGGGAYLYDSSPDFINVEIKDNYSNAEYVAEGGGIYFENYCNSIFINATISNNTLEGVICRGGGVVSKYFSDVIFNDSKIENNTIIGSEYNWGGGIYAGLNSILYLNRCSVSNNGISGSSVSNDGAGIFFIQGQFSAVNCLISNNYLAEETYGINGIGLYIAMCNQLALINSTVSGNQHKNHLQSAYSAIKLLDVTGAFKNSIFWNENLSIEFVSSVQDDLEINYSNIKGGWAGIENIDEDPLFVDDSTFVIQLNSPCVNAGTNYAVPYVDILGNPRPMPMFTNPDMGAYEVDQPVGFQNKEAELNITVFPNPVLNKATIHFPNPETGICSFQIIDVFGNIIEEFESVTGNEIIFHRNGLPSGVYWGRLIGIEKKTKLVKIILQ